jgi:hypothetical protein
MTDHRMNAEYQRAVSDFVGREVIYCVSTLISEMCQLMPDDETLFELCIPEDWETPAYDEGWRAIKTAEGDNWTYVDSNYEGAPSEDDDSLPGLYDDAAETWRAACDDNNIEPYQTEALEHWIVSTYLANKLRDKGEMVGEIMGLTIWGRTTFGQAISIDCVIEDIYDEGQKRLADVA